MWLKRGRYPAQLRVVHYSWCVPQKKIRSLITSSIVQTRAIDRYPDRNMQTRRPALTKYYSLANVLASQKWCRTRNSPHNRVNNTFMFHIQSHIKWLLFYLPDSVDAWLSLLVYSIYSSAYMHCHQCRWDEEQYMTQKRTLAKVMLLTHKSRFISCALTCSNWHQFSDDIWRTHDARTLWFVYHVTIWKTVAFAVTKMTWQVNTSSPEISHPPHTAMIWGRQLIPTPMRFFFCFFFLFSVKSQYAFPPLTAGYV